MLKPWLMEKLEKEGKLHRTLEDIERPLRPEEMWDLIHGRTWDYKVNMSELVERDVVLMDVLYVLACRVSEALRLRAYQFDIASDENFLIVRNLALVKRKKLARSKHGLRGPKLREEIPLPRRGPLAPFTAEIETYVSRLPSDAYVFPVARRYNGELNYAKSMDRRRAWKIVRHVTGVWCHYFRSQGESYYAKVFNSAWALKDFMGLTDTKTLDRYVKTDWRDFEKQLLARR